MEGNECLELPERRDISYMSGSDVIERDRVHRGHFKRLLRLVISSDLLCLPFSRREA
jgi:hypothetical protein